jgi:hypothetical protein
LILTDAGVESGNFESLMRKMARDGINVSTVLVGPERHSEFLVQLAQWGNGRYYNASDRFNLPEVILKQPSTAKLPAWRTGVHSVRARSGSPWLGDLGTEPIPDIQGYVETEARGPAQVLLEVAKENAPLVATWQFGLGRVTSITTELFGPGTEGWQTWSHLAPMLARILSRTAADELLPFSFRIEREGSQVLVVAERRSQNETLPAGTLLLADGQATALTFTQVAPQTFEARFLAEETLDLKIEAYPSETRQPLSRFVSVGRGKPHEELAAPKLDANELTALTGGSVFTDRIPVSVPLSNSGGSPIAQRLWPLLLLLAIVFYLIDILVRRLPGRAATEIQR